ncbi:MAG: NUDIX hydrolase [Candidatus Woesearchaeota archaeon]
MTKIRRKGVAIVDTSKGIVVVSGRSKHFMLPGGGAEKWESRKKAAIRELYEETNLKTKKITYLFSYIGNKWHTFKGNSIKNYAKVFLVKAEGIAKPKHEIKYIDYWKPNSKIHITSGTQKVIEKYLTEFKK